MGTAFLLLAVSLAFIITWLALSGPPEPRRERPAVVVKLYPLAGSAARAPTPPATKAPSPDTSPPPSASPKIAEPGPAVPQVRTAVPAPVAAPETPSPAVPTAKDEQVPDQPESGGPSIDPAFAPAPDAPSAPPPPPAETARITLRAAAPVALPPAPDPALVEETRLGLLPRISPDGRKPWQAYARPFDATNRRPRIAIIINNLGLSGAATEAAIQRLPGTITLAFAPYSKGLRQWIALARAAGHEVLLDLLMEPVKYPTAVRGAHTLLTSLTVDQNMMRLHWALGRVTGYVGVVNQMGSRFTISQSHVLPILMELERRGLLFVDSRSALRSVAARVAADVGLPRAVNNRFIDAEASRDAIDARLSSLERIARNRGFAVGIGAPFPVTIDRLVRWARGLDAKRLSLAPISAVVDTPHN